NRRWRSWRELRGGARPAWERLGDGSARRYGPERIGLLSMLCVVVVFGVHSLIDWTWYVPADAIPALVCAGWLAGRGPLALKKAFADTPNELQPEGGSADGDPAAGANGARAAIGPSGSERRTSPAGLRASILESRPDSVRIALAAAVIVAALLTAWVQWQPQRSEEAREAALGALAGNLGAARADAESAVSRDPLSIEALFALSTVQSAAGQAIGARATLQRAVRLQPSNPQTWLTLGRFDLTSAPSAALGELRAGIYLDPELISPEALAAGRSEAIQTYNEYVTALRALAQRQTALRTAREQRSRTARAGRRAARQRARRSARSRNRK
ncbi:MAG TPA: hypothetical protein VF927_12185, partial [Solirubrobacteraceae bacterium]